MTTDERCQRLQSALEAIIELRESGITVIRSDPQHVTYDSYEFGIDYGIRQAKAIARAALDTPVMLYIPYDDVTKWHWLNRPIAYTWGFTPV